MFSILVYKLLFTSPGTSHDKVKFHWRLTWNKTERDTSEIISHARHR